MLPHLKKSANKLGVANWFLSLIFHYDRFLIARLLSFLKCLTAGFPGFFLQHLLEKLNINVIHTFNPRLTSQGGHEPTRGCKGREEDNGTSLRLLCQTSLMIRKSWFFSNKTRIVGGWVFSWRYCNVSLAMMYISLCVTFFFVFLSKLPGIPTSFLLTLSQKLKRCTFVLCIANWGGIL